MRRRVRIRQEYVRAKGGEWATDVIVLEKGENVIAATFVPNQFAYGSGGVPDPGWYLVTIECPA